VLLRYCIRSIFTWENSNTPSNPQSLKSHRQDFIFPLQKNQSIQLQQISWPQLVEGKKAGGQADPAPSSNSANTCSSTKAAPLPCSVDWAECHQGESQEGSGTPALSRHQPTSWHYPAPCCASASQSQEEVPEVCFLFLFILFLDLRCSKLR
jgi:hypothetical protein